MIGVDLAWSDGPAANETGVLALDSDGNVAEAGWTVGVDATTIWINDHADTDTAVFVDAPLVVANQDGQRVCERQVGQGYGAWKVSANSTNLASPRLAGVALRERLEASGWVYCDGSAGSPSRGRTISECYPYTTLVGAPELGYEVERPRYKRKPRGIKISEWRTVRARSCDELIARLAVLGTAVPELELRSHPTTERLLLEPSPLDDRGYKHREDLIDACLAAWSAALWITFGTARCQVLGIDDPLTDADGRRATIIAPARSTQRINRRRPSISR
jgi:predicted RNase H-like nuclease